MTDYSNYKEHLFVFNHVDELEKVFTNLLKNANSFEEKISSLGFKGSESGDADDLELAESLAELNGRILVALDTGLSVLDSVTSEIQYQSLLKLMGTLSVINLSSRTSKSLTQKKNITLFDEVLNNIMVLLTESDVLLEGTLALVRNWNKERGEYSRSHYVRAPYIPKKKAPKVKADSK